MKRFCLVAVFAALLTSPLAAQTTPAAPADPPKTAVDQASYAIGMSMAQSLKGQGLEGMVNAQMIARGLVDALTGAKPAMTQAQANAALQQLDQILRNQQEQMGAKAKQEGEAFLQANAKKPGVKVLASGLQYKVVKPGTGASPKATNKVKVHYHGTFIDGKVFDSSVERGEPIEFPVNGVIPGWTEALQLMKTGGKWQLYIPSNLAYGPQGRPGIPPHSVLVFDVELLEVK